MKPSFTAPGVMLACVCFALSACSGRADSERSDAAPVRVETVLPRLLDGATVIAYSGTIEASESIPLSFAGVGSVARVLVVEGDAVRRGQLLAVLDTSTTRNALDMALATQAQAEDAYNRLLPMSRSGTLPEIKLIEAESNLNRARSSVLIARKNLSDCQLRAPVDGIVGSRDVEPGMNAVPNLTSISIVRIGKVFARVAIPENEISSIRKGQQATVRIAALGDASSDGAVEEIGVVADPLAHAYPVRIGIPNRGGTIRPGMVCRVSIDGSSAASALVLPDEAVMVDEAGRHYVFVAEKGAAVRKFVRHGGYAGDGIAVTGGIGRSDAVIVGGQHKLVDHAAVSVSGDR